MKKLLVVGVVLAMAGVPAYLWVAGSIFGVSPEHPLGRFEVIDAWLGEQGFEAEEVPIDDALRERFPGAAASLRVYTHEYRERMDSRRSRVMVVRDAGGVVRGVGAAFWSGAEEMGAPTSRGERFIGTLWLETAGKRPVFAEQQRGRGRFARQYRVSTFHVGRLVGTWTKTYDSPMDARTITDSVTIHHQ